MSWADFFRRATDSVQHASASSSAPTHPGRTDGESTPIAADNPIRRAEDDTLGRTKFAESFADRLLLLDAQEGVVAGVLGPWGSGKTSFVNLVRARLEKSDVPVLDFNPWMFSGAEQLVESFFFELSAQLQSRPDLGKVAKHLRDYGDIFSGLGWVPVLGPWFARGKAVADFAARVLEARKEGSGSRRSKVAAALRKLSKPIVIVVDDVDRLSTSEIRDVFKLLRLTANFPNVLYVVAFDRKRVEKALAEQGIPGRDYLEKILQVCVDLPAIPEDVLQQHVFSAIDEVLATVSSKAPFDSNAWPDVFVELIRPLLRNLRDVRRFAAAVHITATDLDGQVAIVDFLGLEAIRLFLPDVFRLLDQASESLTKPSDRIYRGTDPEEHLKANINLLLEAAGEHSKVARAMIQRLFPAGGRHLGGSHYSSDWSGRWLRNRRVAHPDVLRMYLERVGNNGLRTFTAAEQAWDRFENADELNAYLRSLDSSILESTIAALENFEESFGPANAIPASIVLLNLLPDLPERQRGMFDFGPRMVVGRVVYRLVRSLKDPTEIERAVREILPHVSTLSSRLELVTDVGYREDAGHKLVSEEAAQDLERAWRDQVRTANVERLVVDGNVLRVLFRARRDSGEDEPVLEVSGDPRLTLAVLESSYSEALRQGMDSRAVRRLPRLAWEVLVEVYGSEELLCARIAELRDSGLASGRSILALSEKYAGGWRPKDFDEQ